MASTWNELLEKKLTEKFGNKKGKELFDTYGAAFPSSYRDEYSAEEAIIDINYIQTLSETNPLVPHLHLAGEKAYFPLHLRLYQRQTPLALSDILPMLENLNLRTFNEHPYKLRISNDLNIWISDFSVAYNSPNFNVDDALKNFQDAFEQIYFGKCENDGFNKLILAASLTWREIVILRTYAKYLRQIGFRFTQPYIENALLNNANIARELVNLFITLHNPKTKSSAKATAEKIEASIAQSLEKVTSLDEDRIIRRMLELIKNTLRTNYFVTDSAGKPKDYIAIKLNSRVITDMPLPTPMFEIFVYSPRFEGIHLRNAKVARGGIRWSDRREDFRTEILGLMKAQTVKNAVIVPSGAKGGFVLKAILPNASREALQTEVIFCYKSFISGLLDLTDNIKDNKIIPPKNVVCLDEPDSYLVVAADKGTATFSDIANGISNEYGFWLGDAFASGGSVGYDHKKMGITARGAWESIKRHFRELNIDVMRDNFTAVGIGDMSGDVFGNGALYTPQMKLIAAFDHRHIFIDPDPDPQTSFDERKRLFNLPTSSWEDYNPSLISKGGGVFKRSLKSISLTPQMKNALGTEEASLTPNDMIQTILKAPVDLLFNGGIGTYVKASTQTNADVGDRTNDYCRINGDELRCKVVGEGGNLGFTQLGRVEYALNGGLINTDFIDNSAGVDCSDHEVNLKILLNQEVQKGKLTETKRNHLLASMTDEVGKLVLTDNYYQALVMSFTAFHANKNIGLHQAYIKELESIGILNRKVEFLPDDKKLSERKAAEKGLTRPELAVLLAYSKIYIKQELLKSDLPEDPHLLNIVTTAFPAAMSKGYKHEMEEHRLHRDIIATQLSNRIVNEMGITFVYRLQTETNTTIPEIVRAHAVASQIFGTHKLQKTIESLDFKISLSTQYEILFYIRNLTNLATRWFLRGNRINLALDDLIEHYGSRIEKLEDLIPVLMGGATKEYLDKLTKQFAGSGLDDETARKVATYRAIYTALNIIEVSTRHKFDLRKTAEVYFSAGERTNLLWFRDQIATDTREGHWNIMAKITLREELDLAQRALTVVIMSDDRKGIPAAKLIDNWVDKNKTRLARWDHFLSMLHASSDIEYTMFFIAMKELLSIIASSQDKFAALT